MMISSTVPAESASGSAWASAGLATSRAAIEDAVMSMDFISNSLPKRRGSFAPFMIVQGG